MDVRAALIGGLLLSVTVAAGLAGAPTGAAAPWAAPWAGGPFSAHGTRGEGCRLPGCPPAPEVPYPRDLPSARPSAGPGPNSTNQYITNWSTEAGLAVNPLDPANLVAGEVDFAASAYNNTTSYYTNGSIGVSTSMDGGRSWTTQTLPPSPEWSNRSSPWCGQSPDTSPTIAFGPNRTVYVAYITNYDGNPLGATCRAPRATSSLFVSRSTDGGKAWGAPIALGATNLTVDSIVDLSRPWMAVNPSNGSLDIVYGSGSGLIAFQASYDDGLRWTTPRNISSGTNGSAPFLAVDPWGGIDVTWIDQKNASLEFCRSTDGGATFSAPEVIAQSTNGGGGYSESASSPDAFAGFIFPSLAVNAAAGNPYAGRLFEVWQNGTGGSADTPRIELAYSSDNGSLWSKPIVVDPDSHLEGFQPAVTVGSNGTVYVDWYGEDASTGEYWLMGSISHNGGASFGAPYAVSAAASDPSYPGPPYRATWIGDYTDIVPDGHVARTIWTAALSSEGWYCNFACDPVFQFGGIYNLSLATAEMTYANLSSNVPVSIVAAGTAPTPTQLSAVPSYGNWLVGENYSLTAPSSVTSPGGTTSYFALWYGSLISTDPTVSGNVTGPLPLTACYVANPGGFCQTPGAPGQLQVAVQPAGASVTVDGAPLAVNATTGTATAWENDGTYTVAATLAAYYPSSLRVTVTPGNVSYARFSLRRLPGYLNGTVSPAQAVVSVNPTGVVTVAPDGRFHATLLPGAYTVTAALSGYASASANVTIAGNETTWANLTLASQFGWVNGTIFPSSARLQENGRGVAVLPGGQFDLRLAPGSIWLNGSAPGYLSLSLGPLTLAPLGHLAPLLWLPRSTGEVRGTVNPGNASVWVNGSRVALANGTFNLTLPPGTYPYNASASGYTSATGTVTVNDNATVPLRIVLVVSDGWLVATALEPSGVTVAVDGAPVTLTATGTFNLSLAAGPHALTASAAGYRTLRETVQIVAGATVYLSVYLNRLATVASTPTLLEYGAAASVVVAAAAAVGAFAVERRRRRRATRDPSPEP